MQFSGPKTFRGKDRELADDLGRLSTEVERSMRQLEDERAGRWSVVYVRANYRAKLDELLVVDTGVQAVTVTLPKLERRNSGREIAYVRRDTTNGLTFVSPDSTINGAQTFSAAASTGRRPNIAQGLLEWWA